MAKQVLAGLKVADFSWVGVGPMTTRFLADHGATVVRVESSTKPDIARGMPPFKNGQPGLNRSQLFAICNAGKYGLSVDLNHPDGRQVARRLIGWADVVAESFTPGTMQRWRLDYQTISQEQPDIVMLSTCQQGQTGPHARVAGYGGMSTALAGFYYVTGWPDGEPAGSYGAYSDYVCPPLAAGAMLAALDYRRRTGRGQHLDLSQFECALHFLAPAILDYTVNGRVLQRMGNRDPQASPHGAYPCSGDDRWIAIACPDDRSWQALCAALGQPELASDNRFATLALRKQNEDILDEHIGNSTRDQDAWRLMDRLQAAGVAAGVVQAASDLYDDPQMVQREHWVTLDHPEMGPTACDGIPFRLSKTPGRLHRPAPCLGEHSDLVLRDLLGYSETEVAGLRAAGALA